ncbi:MAG TPA: Calx-beta domain-containing protein [Acidimicrobiales bacterium]|nr:Calx-beta domain-containing protein [Acidimicrobiales bacterium]
MKGSACSYSVNVGLFGGPQSLKGCGSGVATTNVGYSPQVSLPASGSATAITASDIDGAKAQYGPAVIHGGIWPLNVASPTASGPQYASTQGTPESGTVTSSADITLKTPPYPTVPCETGYSPPCEDPGGFGPPPVWGDSVHAECTATESSVTGSSTFSNSFIASATDADGAPLPSAIEPIPDNPPANYTRHGVITNVGDVFTVVINEQIPNADGSLTVNAVHMYLFGPVAVGEVIRGQVTCGTTPSPAPASDTIAPDCGTPVVAPVGPSDPQPKEPYTELVGTFDARGLQSITNIQVEHGTVEVGVPSSAQAYLHFTPGQTRPLPVTAVRDAQSETDGLPLIWSFDATDVAGNTAHCSGVNPPRPPGSPLAYNEYYTTPNNTVLTVGAPGVLANDTDPENDPLTVTGTTNVTHGTVSSSADGSFTFTPDNDFWGDGGFDYTISDGNGGTDVGHVKVTVWEPYPTVSVGDVKVYEGNTGTRVAVFPVTMSEVWGHTDVTVDYTTIDGTATAGSDFTSTSGTLTFNPGNTALNIEVPVNGDKADEANETFKVKLSAPTAATLGDSKGVGTIIDDDPSAVIGPRMAIGDVRAYEGNGGFGFMTFTVSLSKASASTVTANLAVLDGTATSWEDFFNFDSFVQFDPGVTSVTILVYVLSDTTAEGDETFTLKLSDPVGATLADGKGLGTIINDDL